MSLKKSEDGIISSEIKSMFNDEEVFLNKINRDEIDLDLYRHKQKDIVNRRKTKLEDEGF